MSYKVLQLSPQASTRVRFGPLQDDLEQSGIDWGAVSGLAISVGLSAAFWTGVALIVERVWR